MSSAVTTDEMDDVFSKKICAIVLTGVSKLNPSSGNGCTLDELTAFVQTEIDGIDRTEDLLDATTQATETLLQRGLLIRCPEGSFQPTDSKLSVPPKDETTLSNSSNVTNTDPAKVSENSSVTSSSSSSSNSVITNNDESFHLDPNRRRSALAVSSSSSAEDIGGPKIFKTQPRKLLKRKGKSIDLPRHRKHRRGQGEEGELTEVPSSDDESGACFNSVGNPGERGWL